MIKKFWSNLNLYKKMAVFFAEVIVVFVAAAVLINQFIILRSYVELEEKFITNRVLRIEKLISNSVDNLDRICLDWAHWDDSYRFMQDKNQEYLNSNFADPGETLKTLKIDMIIYIDREGKIIYSKFYDSNEDLEKPLPQNLIDSIISGLIPETGPINPDDSGEIKSIKGALPVDDKIMLLSSNSILTSEGPGSPKGMLVMGYFYDDEIEDLSVLTDTQIQFFNLNNEQNYTEFFNIYNEIINKKSVKIIYQKQNHYSGFDVLQDITGNDAILLKASGAREIYLHGKTTVLITSSIVSISSAVLSLLTLLTLNILFFRRVYNLSLSVKKIGDEKNISKRLVTEGNDEITSVAKNINKMLEELENSHNQVINSQNMYKELFENSLDGIYRSNSDGRYISVNNALVEMLGYESREELLLVNTKDLYYYPETRPDLDERARPFNKILKKKDGTKIFVQISPRVVYKNKKPVYYEGIIRDVTAQKEFEEKIKYISFHDSLTDLYNRAYFDEELKRLKNTRQLPLTVVMGDVNGLKTINDTYGHAKGDLMLKKIAVILKECFRSEDVIARIGGDEFCIILRDTTKENAEKIIERVNEKCVSRSTKTMPLSIAFGIKTKDTIDMKLKEVINEAEIRMYETKRINKIFHS